MQDPNEPYDWRKSDKFQTWCPNCMAQGVAVPQKSGRTFFECEPCSAAWAADDPEITPLSCRQGLYTDVQEPQERFKLELKAFHLMIDEIRIVEMKGEEGREDQILSKIRWPSCKRERLGNADHIMWQRHKGEKSTRC
eukprot:g27055.t1